MALNTQEAGLQEPVKLLHTKTLAKNFKYQLWR